MPSIDSEYVALCRQLAQIQQRCSGLVSEQAAQLIALRAEVVRLRGQVIVRDTQLAQVRDELAQWQAGHPGLPRRKAMGLQIQHLVARIASLTRECMRWQQAAQRPSAAASSVAARTEQVEALAAQPLTAASLAQADWVICQTGCISHDDYWRVQDHCRRTGKPCLLVEPAEAAASGVPSAAREPIVLLRMARGAEHEDGTV